MYRINTIVKGENKMRSLAIAALLFIVGFGSASAQYPRLPVLTLTGVDGGYNSQWFENGRIIMPRNVNYEREFLVPVFIDNRWAQNPNKYSVDLPIEPITSFKFELAYDSGSVRPVGIEKVHPLYAPQFAKNTEPLAANFNIVWDDVVNKKYFTHLDTNNTAASRGRTVVIAGSSMKPLPNTDLNFQEFKVLLYVRFKVILKEGERNEYDHTYFHIGRDSIYYNDLNILKEAPFTEFRTYDTQVGLDFPNPQTPNFYANAGVVFTGLAGMDNRREFELELVDKKILPGGIWLELMTTQPEFGFAINRSIGTQPPIRLVNASNNALYEMTDPMTVDLNVNGNQNPFPNVATRNIEILNSEEQTLLKNIEVSSDEPWLRFRTRGMNNPIPVLSRRGVIDYIDNGLLGEPNIRDEKNNIPEDRGPISLEINCDPRLIAAGQDSQDDPEIEKTGIYTGYITLKSSFAGISPVRIKVTFIYFRAPLEGQSPSGSRSSGINISLTNRDADMTNLIFGTGDRATLGVDSLYGEYAYQTQLSSTELEARFYPLDANGEELPELQFGLGDFSTNDDQSKSNSRDIRSSDDTTRSLLYKVKFNPGAANKDQRYPIIVTWNVKDFIPGSQAFIRDTENGVIFDPVDMIAAGTGSGDIRTFKIDDPRIREFIIEYTPAKLIEYVDTEGNPLINPGWNLLSTPLNPLGGGSPWKGALTRNPYFFFLSSYQQELAQNVRPGIGYFVKYGPELSEIDRVFRGSNIIEISPLVNPVKVSVADSGRGGWNTIGAASIPLSVEAIDFRQFNNSPRPDKNYTLQAGIWKYETKRGYQEVSELQPGLGYWIKVNNVGYYYLSAANAKLTQSTPAMLAFRNDAKELATEIVIADNNQSAKSLYVSNKYDANLANFELPPLPPSFDVRFEGNTELTNNNESIIQLTNVEYPVSISANGLNGTFELTDAATGEYFGTISSTDYTSVQINNSSNAIKMKKVETENSSELSSVYPNPVVNTATINFNLPESGNVNVTLIDAVGNTVANIYSGSIDAGSQSVDFNANGFTSGNYFVKVVSGNYNKVLRLQIVK